MAAASKKPLAGLVIDYSVAHSKADTLEFGCSCFEQIADRSKSAAVRRGLSYEYAELSAVYADYLQGRYRNSAGSMTRKALFVGVEHQILPWLFGRAGVAHDFRGFSSPTLGIGATPSKTTAIDIAIQRDMFPELRPEFGRSRLLNISANLSF